MNDIMMPHLPDGFAEPWQAQIFAVTVALNEAGFFSWQEWADVFSTQLADSKQKLARGLDGSDDYFACWENALKLLIKSKDIVAETVWDDAMEKWRAAYMKTPHGQPVYFPE
ncbi:MAG: nitrile hydratase accessory protein [Alphaproteobacteria bacterium]